MAFLYFILNTAQEVADNPKSQYFLPKILESVKGHNSEGNLLPIEKDKWDLGNITGTPGQTITTAFQNNWLTYLEKVKKVDLSGQVAIANLETPYPILKLGYDDTNKIIIAGLENIKIFSVDILSTTETAYTSKVSLQFNQWTKSNSGTDYPVLQVNTPYVLSQNLCLANKGENTCNGNESTDINGNGTAIILIKDAYVDVDVTTTIDGTGTSRKISTKITKLTLRGTDVNSTPSLDIQELTIGANVSQFLLDVWENAARKAILSPDGTTGIFNQISQALNESNNINSLSVTISEQIGNILDDLFGSVAVGELPNSAATAGVNNVDHYLVDRASYSLDTLGNHWYLPKLLCSLKNPNLEPFTEAKISIPDISISSLGIIATDVSLSSMVITGLSNALTPEKDMLFKPNSLSFSAVLGKLNPPPKLDCDCKGIPAPPATVAGNFSLKIAGTPLTGQMTITLSTPQLAATVNSAGNTPETLDITVQSLEVSFTNLKNMTIKLKIQSEFEGIINSVLNTNNIKTMILSKVNDAFTSNLASISQAVTQQAKTIIQSKLN